jgi:hypothetical protein
MANMETNPMNVGVVGLLEKSVWPPHPDDLLIPVWDTGAFINEMAKLEILPQKLTGPTDSDQTEVQQNPETLLEKAQEQAPDGTSYSTFDCTYMLEFLSRIVLTWC